MVQISSAENHLAFVLTCLQTALDSGGKVDYETTAKAHGMAYRTAYLRLWNLKKKAGVGGGSKASVQDDDEPGGQPRAPTKKRGRPPGPGKGRATKKQKMEEEVIIADAESGAEDENAEEEHGIEDNEADLKIMAEENEGEEKE